MPFIKLDTRMREHGDVLRKIRGAPFTVYIVLATHINYRRQCFPSITTLARETGYSRRVVMRAIQRLESVGAIVVDRRRGYEGFKNQSSIYTLQWLVSYGRSQETESRANQAVVAT